MKRSLPLNAVRVFELAAQHSSFTKAAEELSLTPAAVSAQVKLLEAYLGTPLFVRSNNRLNGGRSYDGYQSCSCTQRCFSTHVRCAAFTS